MQDCLTLTAKKKALGPSTVIGHVLAGLYHAVPFQRQSGCDAENIQSLFSHCRVS